MRLRCEIAMDAGYNHLFYMPNYLGKITMFSGFVIKRSAILCSLAMCIPFASLAEDTIEVTAKAGNAADLPTSGYTAKTTKGATKTDQPLILTATGGIGGDASANG